MSSGNSVRCRPTMKMPVVDQLGNRIVREEEGVWRLQRAEGDSCVNKIVTFKRKVARSSRDSGRCVARELLEVGKKSVIDEG